MHPVTVHHLAAGRGVRAEQIVEGAEAADLAVTPEAPGRRAEPPDVLGRVTGVGELPVEHAPQALGADQEVPATEVAVHRDPWAGRGPVLVQPARAELERRARLAQRVEEGQGVTQGVGGREPVDRPRVDGVDGGQRAAALRRQRAPGPGPLRVAQDLARDGLALQPLDHQPVGAQVVVHAHGHDGGHRDPRRGAAWSSDRSMGTLPDWAPMSPRSIWRMSRRGAAPGDSSSNALVTLDAPPESRCRSRTVPPRCAPSAAAISSRATVPSSAPLGDGDDGPPAVVELMEVLADAEAGSDPAARVLVGPHRARPSLTMVPPAWPMSATRRTSPRSG